jgi:hypothetical protein
MSNNILILSSVLLSAPWIIATRSWHGPETEPLDKPRLIIQKYICHTYCDRVEETYRKTAVTAEHQLSTSPTEERRQIQSTYHELIPARNASLAAMQGSPSGSNVRYYPTWKHSPLKERNEKGCYNAWTARCLQLGCESLRLFIADQYEIFRPSPCPVLHQHCTKDVYTPQGSTRDPWTVQCGSSQYITHISNVRLQCAYC